MFSAELVDWFVAQRISMETAVWRQGMPGWTRIAAVDHLTSLLLDHTRTILVQPTLPPPRDAEGLEAYLHTVAVQISAQRAPLPPSVAPPTGRWRYAAALLGLATIVATLTHFLTRV